MIKHRRVTGCGRYNKIDLVLRSSPKGITTVSFTSWITYSQFPCVQLYDNISLADGGLPMSAQASTSPFGILWP
jgi:hypothetical protein